MDGPVTLHAVPAPRLAPDTVLVVAEALLPLLYWRGVSVLQEKRQDLTVLERFALELGLTFGSIEPEDFAEITSLPSSALAGATWRLISSGTLYPRGGSYGVNPEQAAAALQQRTVSRLVRSSADFVLLPRSGDVLAVGGRDGGWPRAVEQTVLPDRQAPLPPDLRTATRAAYLAEKVRAKAVAGLDPAVIDVPLPDRDDPPLVPPAKRGDGRWVPVCPTYLCRAEIRRAETGTHVVDAIVCGQARRGGRKDSRRIDSRREGSGREAGGHEDEAQSGAEVAIDLSGADGLIAEWLKLSDALDDPQLRQAAWRELGPPATGFGRPPLDGAQRRGPAQWDLLVNGTAVRELCGQGRPITEPRGLAVEADGVIIHIGCYFFPTDDEGRALFARDEVISRLLSAQEPAEELAPACREAAARCPGAGNVLSADAIRERAWQLGHYHLVYLLREQEDFPHD